MTGQVLSANFTRPADVTAYTANDLVANNTVAGSVVPLSWGVGPIGTAYLILGARLKKSTNVVTAASFRLWLYTSPPTVAGGDNAAFSSTQSGHIGTIDLDMSGAAGRVFSDPAAEVVGAPASGQALEVQGPTGTTAQTTTVYGLLQALGAYAPGNAEVFTVELLVEALNGR